MKRIILGVTIAITAFINGCALQPKTENDIKFDRDVTERLALRKADFTEFDLIDYYRENYPLKRSKKLAKMYCDSNHLPSKVNEGLDMFAELRDRQSKAQTIKEYQEIEAQLRINNVISLEIYDSYCASEDNIFEP